MVDAEDEFARTCWVLRNDKPQPPKEVTSVRICRDPAFATDEILKMKDVTMTMCA